MGRILYKSSHWVGCALKMHGLVEWSYRNWMLWHMNHDSEWGFFNFAEDYIESHFPNPNR